MISLIVMTGSRWQQVMRSLARPDALVYSTATKEFARFGRTVYLPNIVRRILTVVAAKNGDVAWYEDVVEAVWGDDPAGGPDDPRNTLSTQISQNRKKVQALGVDIVARRGYGFRLVDLNSNSCGAGSRHGLRQEGGRNVVAALAPEAPLPEPGLSHATFR